MSKEARKLGPNTLAQLQNLVKRDPDGYKEEFTQQYMHYKSLLNVFTIKPGSPPQELGKLISFLSAVAHCYPDTLQEFPNELKTLLEEHASVLQPDLRLAMCRGLMLLQNKQLIASADVLRLFFTLFRCADKALRSMLYTHILSDIKRLNRKKKNNSVNRSLQSFMYTMLKDDNITAARRSLDIMIELYIKGVWSDARTVNVIASACLSKQTKLMAPALRFFLMSNEELQAAARGDKDEEGDERQAEEDYNRVLHANSHAKKTQKRSARRNKALRALRKKRNHENSPESFNFAAIHLLHDPQKLADQVYRRLVAAKSERFEIRLMMMNFVSRLIGIHELFVLDFYSFLQRYLHPHQQEVTHVLTFLAQASHSLVPTDTLESVVMTIATNFISERSSPEAIAVGLNSIREICVRCPLAMTQTLLEDLVQYKSHRSKSVVMAARSLIQAYRELNPELLPKKQRGRPGDTYDPSKKALEYGQVAVADTVPGTELLALLEQEKRKEKAAEAKANEGWVTDSDGDGNDDDDDDDDEDEDDDDSEEDDWEALEDHPKESKVVRGLRMKGPRAKKLRDELKDKPELLEEHEMAVQRRLADQDDEQEDPMEALKKRAERAKQLSSTRILTQEDFRRIRKLKEEQLMSGKRSSLEAHETLDVDDILPDMKKPRQDKAARLELVYQGREGRGKFGTPKGRLNEHASTTNREKRKAKNTMMLKASRSFRSKKKLAMHVKQMLSHNNKKSFGKKKNIST